MKRWVGLGQDLHLATEWISHNVHMFDIVSALVCLFIFCAIRNRIQFKGPMVWPILGPFPSFLLHIFDIHEWTTNNLIRSGGTYFFEGLWFIEPDGVLTADPVNMEYFLKTNFKNYPKGTYFTQRFADMLGDGIFNSDGNIWKEQRRIATVEMHASRFLEYSTQTAHELLDKKLLKVIHSYCLSGKSMDFQNLLLKFGFDNVCLVTFGVNPGSLDLHDNQVAFAKAYEESSQYTMYRFMMPPALWKLMKYFDIGYEKRLKKSIKVLHEFVDRVVENRMNELHRYGSLNGKHDILSRLLLRAAAKAEDKMSQVISSKFLRELCVNLLLAGRDTSSVALTWFFWLIHKHPEVETRILQEITKIVYQQGKGTNEQLVVFTTEELKKMTYLEAALSEVLRLYPAVPVDFKLASEEDVFPDGTRITKGSRVFYHIYSTGRLESLWGNDCREFKPERWIRKGQLVKENQFKYPVFNAGPRMCLGKKLAVAQMKLVAASILLRYAVKVVEGHVVAPKFTNTLQMRNGLQVTFVPRES